MAPFFAKDLQQQRRGAIGDNMLLGIVRRGVHQAHHLDDSRDPVEITERCMQRAKQIDGHGSCR